jgi:Cu+-exporting ATPase
MEQKEYKVEGMSCSSCSLHVEKSVQDIKGISNIQVSLLHNSLTFNYDSELGEIDDQQIVKRVSDAGYTAIPTQKVESKGDRNSFHDDYLREKKGRKRRLVYSILFSIPLIYIGMSDMLHLPLFQLFAGEKGTFAFAFTQFLLAIAVILVNHETITSGMRTLSKRKPTMDSLIALGSLAALGYGIITLFQLSMALWTRDSQLIFELRHFLYFESAAMILTFVLIGKYLEFLAKGRASRAIEKLLELQSEVATVLRDNKEIEIPTQEVTLQDIVIVRPGFRFPVDGTIIKGSTSVDESSLSGESLPVEKTEGSLVYASTINTTGYVHVQATKVGEDTTFSQIVALVEQAAISKAPIARLADTISLYFVPIVIALAIITTIVWLFVSSSIAIALSFGISVLVISCPCALGLATPTAIMVAMGKSSEKGILIRQSLSLQNLAKVDTIVFDKTHTITEGNLRVQSLISSSPEELLQIASALENKSEHPIAQAIILYAKEMKIAIKDSDEVKAIVGKGIMGTLDFQPIYGGTSDFLKEYSIEVPNESSEVEKEGKIVVHFGQGNRYVGSVVISDTIKSSSAQAIAQLKKRNYRIIMLTGDSQASANAIAQQVGIDEVYARVLPDGKERVISSLQDEGHIVAMVGDGINDAPSLMRADVGIALHGSSDIAIESGDILLVKDDISDVAVAIDLSKRTMRIIKQNLFWALFYNVLGIPIAAGLFFPLFGLKLSPMFAAFAMSLSSIFVVTNALRLKREKKVKTIYIKEEKIMIEKELSIKGMMCNNCVNHVKKALESIEGVTAKVSLEDNQAIVSSVSDIDDALLKEKIVEAGYQVTSIKRG